MTTTIDRVSLAALMKAGNAIREAHEFMGQAIFTKTDASEYVLALEDGNSNKDQAIDHFMAEREDLKGQIETANAVLLHVADYGNALQERLNSIGISYRAHEETGEPIITVNWATLAEAFDIVE